MNELKALILDYLDGVVFAELPEISDKCRITQLMVKKVLYELENEGKITSWWNETEGDATLSYEKIDSPSYKLTYSEGFTIGYREGKDVAVRDAFEAGRQDVLAKLKVLF